MFLKKLYILIIIAFFSITINTQNFAAQAEKITEVNRDSAKMSPNSEKSKISKIKEDIQLYFEIFSEMSPSARCDFIKEIVAFHVSENKNKYIIGSAVTATAIVAYIYFHNSNKIN
ncbi:hypothetical protein KJ644_01835 [Candidatus Dependentiae bacterium]|nr:hypothetical protein [Candidatus Dependentiae bacterium]MBU4387192.1 hypothetical protein [Candidatus Dependentiae bacterium]MCG2756172.1 hypothetical protein [Candidatus Dependentiae bacterium]